MQVEQSQSVWERSTLRSYQRSYFRLELSMLWWFRRSELGRAIALPMRHVISMNPARDVSMLTWMGFVCGIFYHGYHFTVNCAMNVGFVLLARALVSARRPIEYDVHLKQLADRTRGNYGLPSLETHMAVVVFGQLAAKGVEDVQGTQFEFLEGVIAGGSAALVGVIALSRLVAGSRFVYQVVASLGTGLLGITYATKYVTSKIQPWRNEWHDLAKNREHFVFLVVIMALGAAYIAAGAEDNSSWFFSIPNEEFVRVMRSVYTQPSGGGRAAYHPRRVKRGQQFAPPDALSNLTARLSARPRSTPVV